jgi:2'-5' RNA ligase
VWLSIGEGAKEIAALASRGERTLVAGGHLAPSTRPFAAHVTLGRPKGARGFGRLTDFLASLAPPEAAGRIEEVTLAESRLTPRGAQYEALATFRLGGAAAEASAPHEGESE